MRDRARVEQLDLVLRLAPLTVLVSTSVVQVIVYLFWRPSDRVYLTILELLILPLAIVALEQCWRWRSRPKPAVVSAWFLHAVILVSHLFGCLLASIPIALFARADADGRLLIASCCAGLIATGMSAAVLPRAAIGYSGPIIIGSFLALAATGERFYVYVAILLTLYAAFVCCTIIHLSHLVTMRVVAQAELERQQEFTHLLLNDFEENSSDWLWETDADLRLKHVSPRLIDIAGRSERQLHGLPLEKLLQPPLAKRSGHSNAHLWKQVAERRSFQNVLVPLEISGEQRTWSLSGKPTLSRSGEFSGYRGVGSDVTEKKRSEERLSFLALHDPLTELPNRVLFQQCLDEACKTRQAHQRIAVLALDLDEFKSVNDTFGHAAGDELLRAVANRLSLFVNAEVLVARLAGDEFAILATGVRQDDIHAIEMLAGNIVDAITPPFYIQGIRVTVGVSVGIALAPDDGCAEIMRRADVALYRMKNEGRGGYRFYAAEMDERIEVRRALAADLREALDRREFELHFQPIVMAGTGRVRCFEALLRWNHKSGGFVSPADFIPLAEETGAIIPIGEWVLQEACRVAAKWPSDINVAVNLSPVQFRHSDLPRLVRSALRDSGLDARRLELEVTESVFLEATPYVRTTLGILRSMEVRLSLDDFGTGYSSLSYLRRIAFDKLKIDQCFVRDLPNEKSGTAIVRAMVDLATSLGMTVTAEGVETEAQWQCLLQQGCHEFQGFLFGKPVPAAEALLIGAQQGRLPAHHQAA